MTNGLLESIRRMREFSEKQRKLEEGTYEEPEEKDEYSRSKDGDFSVLVDRIRSRGLLYDTDRVFDLNYVDRMSEIEGKDYVSDGQRSVDPAISALVDQILNEAIQYGASDIQIGLRAGDVIVRFRVDGRMVDHRLVDGGAYRALSSRIKRLANVSISEFHRPLDGSFSYEYKGTKYDIRLSTLPTHRGESISLRLLYSSELPERLEDLGINDYVLERFRRAIMSREGMVLLTGPTGSGKTTTLYTSIEEIKREFNNEKNIITLENPVEYVIEGITQSQIDLLRDYDFSDGLRAVLRQNPDIILVGEIRDALTADTAVRASNTGHLVFSTLHAKDAASVVSVLRQLGVDPYNISNSLRMVLNQRLLPKLCEYCKVSEPLDDYDKSKFPEISEKFVTKGCEHCDFVGFNGRVLVVEMLDVSDKFRELIFKDIPADQMLKVLQEDPSYYSLRQDLVRYLEAGFISLNDALRLL